jgi:hypothetical protein
MRIVKQVLKVVGLVLVLVLGTGASYVGWQVHAFNASLERVYDVPVPTITLSTDPAVLARGKHVAEAVMPCAIADCHGPDFAGGKSLDLGPLGVLTGPNITTAGLGAAYSDGEIARLLRHGIKKDGRTIRFMPVQESSWLPDSDVVAIISYLRSMPPVDKANGPVDLRPMAKVLDRRDAFVIDVARRIPHDHIELAPSPTPTVEYGRFVSRMCTGCHGDHLSGGRPDGWPPPFPTPLNLTPHDTGLKAWTYGDFAKMLDTGVRKNGEAIRPPMPREAFAKYDETERHALWAYLESLPPTPLGNR